MSSSPSSSSKSKSSLSYPPFTLEKSRYDDSNFIGRFQHFLDVIDPSTLLATKKQIENSIELLEQFKNNNHQPPEGISDESLWKARKLRDTIFHPDTGEKIPMPFRMSGYVPFGSPIVLALLLPHQSIPWMLFWQWMNQTHNALVNYYNRPISPESRDQVSSTTILGGYLGAVTSAMAVSTGLTEGIRHYHGISEATRSSLLRFVPFPAVASANVCNVYLMRRQDLDTGIQVKDGNDGSNIGLSKEAAKRALTSTAITRAFLPAPIFVMPPLIMSAISKTSLFQKYPRINIPVHFAVTTLCFGFALPAAISIFPQQGTIQKGDLEPELQQKMSSSFAVYNKGL